MNPIIESIRDQIDVAANALSTLLEANIVRDIDTIEDGVPRIQVDRDMFETLFGNDYERVHAYSSYEYRVHKVGSVYISAPARIEVEDEG